MAYYRKRGKAWQVQVEKNGIRRSATFDSKTEAKDWAATMESELITPQKDNDILVSALFKKYQKEVVPHHKGERWEKIRLNKLGKELGKYTVQELIDTDKLAIWKNQRLKEVKPGTVAREMQLLNQVFEAARREWRMIGENPLTYIKKPKGAKRNRLISQEEIDAVCNSLNYTHQSVVLTKQQQVGLALHIALETALRAGEILKLDSSCGKVANVKNTKNGDDRKVPLSKAARNLLSRIPDGGWTLGSAELSTLFGKARKKCGYPNGENGGFTFHDSRANALTMLSKKLDILALAKMAGHRDPRSLMIYYRESEEDIADRL